jgi:hypothetical protein
LGSLGLLQLLPDQEPRLACGDGGAITTNDAALAEHVKRLRQYGWTRKYHSVEHGRNSRLDDMQAAILREKLPLLDGWNQRRREIAAAFSEALAGSGVDCPRGCNEKFVRAPLRDPQRATRCTSRCARRPRRGDRDPLSRTRPPAGVRAAASSAVVTRPPSALRARSSHCRAYPELRDDEIANDRAGSS